MMLDRRAYGLNPHTQFAEMPREPRLRHHE